jgi:fatty acid desaturase
MRWALPVVWTGDLRPRGGRSRQRETVMWRVLGIIALIWVGLMVLGAVLKFLVWALVIGAVLFVGTVAYSALKGDPDKKAIR